MPLDSEFPYDEQAHRHIPVLDALVLKLLAERSYTVAELTSAANVFVQSTRARERDGRMRHADELDAEAAELRAQAKTLKSAGGASDQTQVKMLENAADQASRNAVGIRDAANAPDPVLDALLIGRWMTHAFQRRFIETNPDNAADVVTLANAGKWRRATIHPFSMSTLTDPPSAFKKLGIGGFVGSVLAGKTIAVATLPLTVPAALGAHFASQGMRLALTSTVLEEVVAKEQRLRR